jgi:hypothetical protein
LCKSFIFKYGENYRVLDMWEITCRNNYLAIKEKPVFRRHVTISEPNHSRQEITKNLGKIASVLKGQAIKNYPDNLSFWDVHSLFKSV